MLLPQLKIAFGNSDKNAIISQVSSQHTFSMQGQKAKGLGFAGNTITIVTQLHSRGLEAVVDNAQLDMSQSKPASSWIWPDGHTFLTLSQMTVSCPLLPLFSPHRIISGTNQKSLEQAWTANK